MTPNAQRFHDIYLGELEGQIIKRPEKYAYGLPLAPTVAAKMVAALTTGRGNKDSLAVKHTCKKLGIAYRYADIKAYLTEDEGQFDDSDDPTSVLYRHTDA